MTKGFNPEHHRPRDMRGIHSGADFVVMGCGHQVRDPGWAPPSPSITMGVNDIGHWQHPKYLLVMDHLGAFRGKRAPYVLGSDAERVFLLDSAHGLHDQYGDRVRSFRRGERFGVKPFDGVICDYGTTSIYPACLVCEFLGARSIGLAGVQFIDHHLSARIVKIRDIFATLGAALLERGVFLYNMAKDSLLTSVPYCDWNEREEYLA